MKLFSEITNESQQNENIVSAAELAQYISKIGKMLSKEIQVLLTYIQKYNILSKEEVDILMNSNKSRLMEFIHTHKGMDIKEAQDIQKLLRSITKDIRLLPMFQSPSERADLLSGSKTVEDITLDLDTEKGREEVAKKYAPLVTTIANKFLGKSSMGRNELISAGMLGLTKAINNYRKPEEYIYIDDKILDKKEAANTKHLSFKQYASWMIRNAILFDMNHLSRVVKIGQHGYEQNKKKDDDNKNWEMSIDRDLQGDDMALDRLANISSNPRLMAPDAKDQWRQLFKILEGKFNTRSLSMFYKYFGLNGYDKMTGTEIAREFGLTGSRVSGIIKKIMDFLKEDPKTKSILSDLMDIYTESLLVKCLNKTKEDILEMFAQDDIYILLEDIVRWNNKEQLQRTLATTLEAFDKKSSDFLYDCLLKGFDFLDANFKKNRKLIVMFLEKMYPTEQFSRKSDVFLLDKFVDIIDAFKNFKLDVEEG